jgi:hypothetical protein
MSRPALRRFWDLLGSTRVGERTAGDPPSANGASSLHLRWELPDRALPLREVSVTLEVVTPPSVDRLYFWALQADFADAEGRPAGGAHLGLQWHPSHPGATAVNWGGYGPSGRELDGSVSPLPSALRNPNTRDYAWRPGEPYRLVIARRTGPGREDGPAAWRGTVVGPDGEATVVRDLLPPGDRISGVVMWSEVFARCDHPTTAVRWSDPMAISLDGTPVAPTRLAVNYQSHARGGCSNTDARVDDVGVLQLTNVERTTPQGTVLAIGGPASDV